MTNRAEGQGSDSEERRRHSTQDAEVEPTKGEGGGWV